jgi:ATP-dependent RNA helicase RhlE
MTFQELGLSEKTVKAIEELGISEPTTVQKNVIPTILEGKDVFTIAPEGSGKTASYIFPLVDIVSRRQGQNILIVTASEDVAVRVSDHMAVFSKFHESEEGGKPENEESEANVIIGSPGLLEELAKEGKLDLSKVNILVVDDIHLIRRNRQLRELERILALLPSEKQNIVYTNRRSRDTKAVLDKILKDTKAEIKIDRNKEMEASGSRRREAPTRQEALIAGFTRPAVPVKDEEALALIETYRSFAGKTPDFLIYKGIVVNGGNS